MNGVFDMTFRELSALAMTIILLLVYGWYSVDLVAEWRVIPVAEIAYEGRLLGMVVFLVALIIVAHIVLAAFNSKTALEDGDERDQLIELKGEARSGLIVGMAAIAAMLLAIAQFDTFYIAHMLLAGLVLSEIFKGVLVLISYRLGS
jgi:hypothetical protein